VPVLGAQGSPYLEAGSWQLNFGYRYQKSDRHFTGNSEERARAREHSEVINDVHLFDFGVTHAFTKRINGSLSVPVLIGTRSSPVRDANRDIVGRDTQRAEAIGDIVVQGSVWLLDPEVHLDKNIQLSLGADLPTGDADVRHRATVRQGNDFFREERTLDQSVQPGDDSFGFIVGLQAFYVFLERYTLFAQGSYLFNPRDVNNVPTFRGGSGESVMSVTDAYIGKAGIATPIPWLEEYGFSASVAARVEGVPVNDALGEDNGFRRPGYAVSIEPGIAWRYGKHTLGLSAPLAVYRNREQSVPDKQATPNRHGDAAFADYLILFSYSYVFGGPEKPAAASVPATADALFAPGRDGFRSWAAR
jgi:hypothetical protein